MSLIKAILSGKEHRREYRRSKAVFADCRNHGHCAFCSADRTHNARKQLVSCEQQLAELNDPVIEIASIKASRPWSVPSGISREEARRNLILLAGDYLFDEPALDDLPTFCWHGKRVGRQSKKRKHSPLGHNNQQQ
jgi:hypothetical protein